jgi:hypothetical protein
MRSGGGRSLVGLKSVGCGLIDKKLGNHNHGSPFFFEAFAQFVNPV